MSAKTYTQLVNELLVNITTNNNKENTGKRVQDVIKDILDTMFTQLKLQYGITANYIYNSGSFAGNKQQTLLTWYAISNLLSATGGNLPIISGGRFSTFADIPYDSLVSGASIHGEVLSANDLILLGGQTDTRENGWWKIADDIADISRPEGFDTTKAGCILGVVDDISGCTYLMIVDDAENVEVNVLNPSIRNFGNITNLNGGAITALDSLSTKFSKPGIRIQIGNTSNSIYELKAGVLAESLPTIIRPDDYAEATSGSGSESKPIYDTNEKYWELVQVQSNNSFISQEIIADTNTGIEQDGNFKFNATGGKLYLQERVGGTWKNINSYKK
jgi:hypothetical protein